MASVRQPVTIDGNEAAAYVAHKTNEVIAIYPITPSSPMGEHADEWSVRGVKNLWGTVPLVIEMQSEGGAAGAVHGALQAGSLTTTFTASQGLLLMMPNMFKIAGELTPTVFHIAARTVATHALSIFGDHSDVMAVRATGWAMLFSNSVQEVMDQALIAQAATLQARVPFMHIFDGFRTSHEVMKIERLSDDDIRSLIDDRLVHELRRRALSPDHPFIRGTAQNPDVFFQEREAANPYYDAVPGIVQEVMDRFAARVGRSYHLFDYVGAPDADRVVVVMGSGAETTEQMADYLNAHGEKVGVLKVRLFRPFSVPHFLRALPPTVRAIAVLDRVKEPGAVGEPLYVDVCAALGSAQRDNPALAEHPPVIVGGRYGISSKEYNPAMAKAVFDNLMEGRRKNNFTVGIEDDVTHTSLDYDHYLDIEPPDVTRAVFWGFGSDGTVSANKNTIKIIGEETPDYAQGYFVYDSKKAGAHTVSHLRFGPRPIHSPYLIQHAGFIGVHQFGFLERFPILDTAADGATLLLNSPYDPERTWDEIPRPVQEAIIAKKLKVYGVNAYAVAQQTGMGNKINTIMQTCFFAISGILPREEAIARIKESIVKTYGKRGEAVVQKNYNAVDASLSGLYEIPVPAQATSTVEPRSKAEAGVPEFVRKVTIPMMEGRGDELPVSAMPVDGTWASGTTRYEKRNIALEVPVWAPEVCIQCGRCSLYCPHAVVRAKVVDEQDWERLLAAQGRGLPAGNAPVEERRLGGNVLATVGEGQLPASVIPPAEGVACTLPGAQPPARMEERPSLGAHLPPTEELRRPAGLAPSLQWLPARWREPELSGKRFTIAVSVEDCTGCGVCVEVCPAKDKRAVGRKALNMEPVLPIREQAVANWAFFKRLPRVTPNAAFRYDTTKNVQLLQPLFEFHSACAGCGETPYLRLLSQLVGDRLYIANATGCSSIYSSNLPGMAYAYNHEGRGPAWSNSLFEDNAEFGLGFRLTLDKQTQFARELVERLRPRLGGELADGLLHADQESHDGIEAQRRRVAELRRRLEGARDPDALNLLSIAGFLVRKSVWAVGGDGWAYDIGYGGLDHVLATGLNVHMLVLDSEVYSNTGGQASKSTDLGAVAKFAVGGKRTPKKDLGMMAMSYGYVYVAQVAMGASDSQTIRAFQEAESYPGPSLIIAYSTCIAQGFNMTFSAAQEKRAVDSGHFILYRYDPRLRAQGRNPLQLDSKAPSIPLREYYYSENRYRMLAQSDPDQAERLLAEAQEHVRERWQLYDYLAHRPVAEAQPELERA